MPGPDMPASKPGEAGTSGRERIAAAKLSELAADARASWDATTLERARCQGPHPLLPRHRRRGAQSAGRGRAAADRLRLGRRDRRDRLSTRARPTAPRCRRWAQAPERFLKRSWGVPARTDSSAARRWPTRRRPSSGITHSSSNRGTSTTEGRALCLGRSPERRLLELFDRLTSRARCTSAVRTQRGA